MLGTTLPPAAPDPVTHTPQGYLVSMPDPMTDHPLRPYDAVLVQSFGGPEGPEQVMPFLENVTRGSGIPPERLAAVALSGGFGTGGVAAVQG